MNVVTLVKERLCAIVDALYQVDLTQIANVDVSLNSGKNNEFGDISCNIAMVLAKHIGQNPRAIAQEMQKKLRDLDDIVSVEIAGPGFLNITFKDSLWHEVAKNLFIAKQDFFKLTDDEKKIRYLIEFVSMNPTGPMHLGAGRNGIIGDVLAKILTFLGHTVHKEFYINDAGNQIKLLGQSFKARCLELLGQPTSVPEGGYVGEYLIDTAKECVNEHGADLQDKDERFFEEYAKNKMLSQLKKTLLDYGIEYDQWFSEYSLHESGEVEKALQELQQKNLAYEKDGALWFKATQFGDDKDRVVRKKTGEMTYIAADIAYHKNKFDRNFDKLIDVLGQDHHGYVKRLQATMEAVGYPHDGLDVILYQLVSIKKDDQVLKMSKRAGTFTQLQEILDLVGTDVARFFYLNRKAEAHLEFDLAVALKKTDENPVFYIQYAYVRTLSLLDKASEHDCFSSFVKDLQKGCCEEELQLSDADKNVLKKIVSFYHLLRSIAASYQTHLLAYYAWELAHTFHNYYANNRIVNVDDIAITKTRLFVVMLVRRTLQDCLELLGVSCPEKM